MLIFKEGSHEYVYDDDIMVFLPKKTYDNSNFEELKNSFNNRFCDYPSSLAINMINSCNLSCSYCYANQGNYNKSGVKIDIEEAKKTIVFFIEYLKTINEKNIRITFFGGEPLLVFDQIKEIVNFCENNFQEMDFRFGTITNGTLLSREIVEFFEKHAFGLSVSIDGDKSTHDKYRKFRDGKGSYDVIMKNIRKLKNLSKCSIRLTITNDNYVIDKSIESLLKESDFNKFTFGIDNSINSLEFNKFIEHYDIFFDKYYNDILEGKFYDVTNITVPIMHLIYRAKSVSYCKAGTSYFALSSDGNIYPCHRFSGNEAMKITNVSELNQIIKHSKKFKEKQVNYKKNKSSNCYKCEYSNICGGICSYDAYCETGNQIGYSEKMCILRKKTFENIFKLLSKLDSNSSDRKEEFIKYILNSKRQG